jgi:hypothetical protein
VADQHNHRIVTVNMPGGGIVSNLAGTIGSPGFTNGVGTAATFKYPTGISFADADTALVADLFNHAIRKIVISTGATTTLAGSGSSGFTNGVGTAAPFNNPDSVAVDGSSGIALVVDTENHAIRRIVIATGETSTLAGSGTAGNQNGIGAAVQFRNPAAIAVKSGIALVADDLNHAIRKIVVSTGQTTTLVGTSASDEGTVDGDGSVARFDRPWGISMNGDSALVTQNGISGPDLIRRVRISDGTTTTLAGSSTTGSADGLGTVATFNRPRGIAMCTEVDGTAFVAEMMNSAVRRLQLD